MAAQYLELPSYYSDLSDDERSRQFLTLIRRLDLKPADVELSFGVSYETARKWTQGICAPSVAVVVALSAIESLDPEERGAFIARRTKVLSENPHAVAERARAARRKAAAEEMTPPPLSAKQAGIVATRGRA